jgi:hypothetical protein
MPAKSFWVRRALAACSASALFAAVACGGRDELDLLDLPQGSGGSSAGAAGKGGSTSGGTTSGGSAGASGSGGSFAGFGGTIAAGAGGTPIGGSAGGGGFAGAGALGGTGGAAGFGGFGGMPIENCTNGIDDDGDGAVDCADPDCVPGYTCAPEVPLGWQGPVKFWEGSSLASAPSCDDGYPSLLFAGMDGLSVDPASCAACACGAPQGIVCASARLRFFTSSDCTSGGGSTRGITANECHPFVFSGADPSGLQWESSPAEGGACLPRTQGSSMFPPARWAEFARACGDAFEGGGCDEEQACVPRPSAPFRSGLCVFHDGDVSCPLGPYQNREVYFRRVADARSCTQCTCGTPSGATCTGALTAGTDRNCNADSVTISSAGMCAALPPDPTPPPEVGFLSSRSFIYESTGPVGGACTPSGGVSTGTATPADPVTVCCL